MDYKDINKKAWDERAEIHQSSEFYDLEGVLAGKQSLNLIELNLLGDVTNKSLLHLQCHMGSESLGWQKLGAQVTGVDLSESAIDTAQVLAQNMQLNAEFVCADIYDFGERNTKEFDLVYTSYGVLCWLPQLDRWAQLIKQALKPGGSLYLIEFHPFHDVFLGYPYFHHPKGHRELETTYTENHQDKEQEIMTWSHSLADVFTALLQSGLKIECFHEYDHSPYACFDGMVEREEGGFQKWIEGQAIPVLYAIKATKV